MKHLISLFIAVSVAFTAMGQTSPPNKLRSNDSFTQVDNYLVAAKRLGIPSGPLLTLDGATTPADAPKLFWRTSDSTLHVYVPALSSWLPAGGGSGGSVVWGDITGDLEDQTDLYSAIEDSYIREWDDNRAYELGDIVVKDSLFYRSLTDANTHVPSLALWVLVSNTTPINWNASTSYSVGDVVLFDPGAPNPYVLQAILPSTNVEPLSPGWVDFWEVIGPFTGVWNPAVEYQSLEFERETVVYDGGLYALPFLQTSPAGIPPVPSYELLGARPGEGLSFSSGAPNVVNLGTEFSNDILPNNTRNKVNVLTTKTENTGSSFNFQNLNSFPSADLWVSTDWAGSSSININSNRVTTVSLEPGGGGSYITVGGSGIDMGAEGDRRVQIHYPGHSEFTSLTYYDVPFAGYVDDKAGLVSSGPIGNNSDFVEFTSYSVNVDLRLVNVAGEVNVVLDAFGGNANLLDVTLLRNTTLTPVNLYDFNDQNPYILQADIPTNGTEHGRIFIYNKLVERMAEFEYFVISGIGFIRAKTWY